MVPPRTPYSVPDRTSARRVFRVAGPRRDRSGRRRPKRTGDRTVLPRTGFGGYDGPGTLEDRSRISWEGTCGILVGVGGTTSERREPKIDGYEGVKKEGGVTRKREL